MDNDSIHKQIYNWQCRVDALKKSKKRLQEEIKHINQEIKSDELTIKFWRESLK
jgi:predicted  nucleic acid-binding Zn-ribbon protein